jgi:hypothetical protein
LLINKPCLLRIKRRLLRVAWRLLRNKRRDIRVSSRFIRVSSYFWQRKKREKRDDLSPSFFTTHCGTESWCQMPIIPQLIMPLRQD